MYVKRGVTVDIDFENKAARGFRREVLIKHEISKTVRHNTAVGWFKLLNDVRVVARNKISAGIKQLSRQSLVATLELPFRIPTPSEAGQ